MVVDGEPVAAVAHGRERVIGTRCRAADLDQGPDWPFGTSLVLLRRPDPVFPYVRLGHTDDGREVDEDLDDRPGQDGEFLVIQSCTPILRIIRSAHVAEHHGTIFHGKQVAVELIVRVLACVAEGLGVRATARGFEVDPNTVLPWLVEAAEHLRAFSCDFLCDVHVKQLQLDELYAVLRDVKNGALSESEASST